MTGRWARLPIRAKLTLAFAGVMTVLLAAAGIALSLLVAHNLDSAVNDGLRARALDAAALVRTATGRDRLARTRETYAQLLAPDGGLIAATPGAGFQPLLSPADVARTRSAPRVADATSPRGDALRVLGRRTRLLGGEAVVVVGEPLTQREHALDALHALLAVGGPLALVVASLVAYLLAAAALRPVERMRRRAAAVSASETGGRLPVPPADDEIGRLGRTLNEMLARLETAFTRERSFVSDASHELRTPLAILRMELELALRGRHTRAELEAAVRSAAEETDRLSRLAEDLLVLARTDQGRLPVRPEDLDADELLERVAARFQTRAHAEGRPLARGPASGVRLHADPARLEQALANLVDNALSYGEGTVALSACRRDGNVELHVRDEGAGFPPAFLPRAFERFSRADEARSRGSAGLGLAIAAAVAGAHGGSAHAENRDRGADVWVSLPSD